MLRTTLIAGALFVAGPALAQPEPVGDRVEVNGMQLYYEVSGEGEPLPASRLAVLPATSHTAVVTQPDLLHAFIEPFLKGEMPKGFFENQSPAPAEVPR